MDFGNFLELLFALAIIFFGLLGGGRKKKERPKPTARPPRSTAPRRPDPDAGLGDLARELDRLLRGASEPDVARAPPPEIAQPDEARSLEALSVDTEERHRRFHEQYVSPLAAPRPLVRSPVPGRPGVPGTPLERIPLRQAIVWREILGSPKGLR